MRFLNLCTGFFEKDMCIRFPCVCVCVSFFNQDSSQVFVGIWICDLWISCCCVWIFSFWTCWCFWTYPDPRHFWRWCSFTKVGYVIVPWRVRWLLKVLKHSMIFLTIYTPENQHGYPKWCLGKGNSLQTWPFWVSMLDFWVSMSMLDLEVSGQHANLYQRREWSHPSTFQSEGTSVLVKLVFWKVANWVTKFWQMSTRRCKLVCFRGSY